MNDLEFIEHAFSGRSTYDQITSSTQLTKFEQEEVSNFVGKHWSSINSGMLSSCFEVIYWFSPEAFCYFLPGILSAGIKEFKSDLVIYDSIIQMLDRSPNPEYWDEVFIERWTLLSKDECDAVQKWLFWIIDSGSNFDEISINRALDTLELLKTLKSNKAK